MDGHRHPIEGRDLPVHRAVHPDPGHRPERGPSGTQQPTLTIGTGSSDRLDVTRAVWSPNSVNKTLQIQGFDVNTGATNTVFATSNGKQIGTPWNQLSDPWNDGYITHNISVPPGTLSVTNPGSVTVKDSLGGSTTIPITVNNKY
jgi:hypothetical protein